MKREDILTASHPKLNDMIDEFIMREQGSYDEYPNWANDIGAAWRIVEKMDHEQKHLVWHEDKNSWVFILGKGSWGRWSAYAPQPSEAICKAALLYRFGFEGFHLPKAEPNT